MRGAVTQNDGARDRSRCLSVGMDLVPNREQAGRYDELLLPTLGPLTHNPATTPTSAPLPPPRACHHARTHSHRTNPSSKQPHPAIPPQKNLRT